MAASKRRPAPRSRTTLNLLIDVSIFVGFLVATAPRLSGIAVHEWLGIAFAAAVVAHLLLHWRWVASVTAQLLRRATAGSRLSYALNLLLFVGVTLITFTGLAISRVALPWLGLDIAPDRAWRAVHRLASDATVILTGVHVAVHWRWIVNAAGKLLSRGRPARALPAAPAEVRR